MSSRTSKSAVIVGAGPGISGALARLLARDGFSIGLLGISAGPLEELEATLRDLGAEVEVVLTDITQSEAAHAAITGLGQRFDEINLLHYNPSAFREEDPLSLSVPHLLADVALGVGGLLTAVQAARPFMVAGGRVTVTGSMAADRPSHKAASLGVQKAGIRNLVRSIDATLCDDGIRAVSVTVRGVLAEQGPFTPDRVARAIYEAANQPDESWESEVPYDGHA